MKFMSYTCGVWEDRHQNKKKWLTDEVGVIIHKRIEVDEAVKGLGLQVSHIKYIVYTLDDELQLFLKLKYPPGTFRDHEA